jgi:hypothetical protein
VQIRPPQFARQQVEVECAVTVSLARVQEQVGPGPHQQVARVLSGGVGQAHADEETEGVGWWGSGGMVGWWDGRLRGGMGGGVMG